MVRHVNIQNPYTLEMSNTPHAGFLTETVSTRDPCPQGPCPNQVHVLSLLGKSLFNSPGIIRSLDHTYLIPQILHGMECCNVATQPWAVKRQD